jgi:hypothetical protein
MKYLVTKTTIEQFIVSDDEDFVSNAGDAIERVKNWGECPDNESVSYSVRELDAEEE